MTILRQTTTRDRIFKKIRGKKNETYSGGNRVQFRVVAFHGAPMMVPVERSDSNAVA